MKSKSMPVKLGLTFLMAVMVVSTGRAWTTGVVSRTWTLGGRHFSSPAIGSDGTIYVGSTNGCLYALNPNGTTQGVWNTGAKIYSTPSIGSGGTIYVGNDDGCLYAFNSDGTTQRVWNAPDRLVGIPSIGRDGTIYAGCDDGLLYAFNPDGTTQRTWSTGRCTTFSSSPAVSSNGMICVAGSYSNVYLFNPDGTTQTVWHTSDGFDANPAFGSNGVVYIGNDSGDFYALNPNGTTQRVWNVGKPIYASAAIGPNGVIYVGTASSNFYAFLPNGTTQHVWTSTNRQEFFSSPAIAADGTIYVGCDDGCVYGFNPNGTTSIVWTCAYGYRIQASPAIGLDGTIYVGNYDSASFYALQGNSSKLAETAWPKFGQNMANTCRALAAATNVSASTLTYENKIAVSWSADPQAIGHQVWRGTNAIPFLAQQIGTSRGTTYNDTSVDAIRTYYYWIRSTNTVFSTIFSVSASGARGVKKPLNVNASKGLFTDHVAISWTASPDAASYEVWRGVTTNVSDAALLTEVATTSYDDASGTADTVYFYWVKSRLGVFRSGFSASSAGFFSEEVETLAAPTGVNATDGTYSDVVRVSWGTVVGASSYEVWRGVTTDVAEAALLTEVVSTSLDDASCAADTVYYYWVRAKAGSDTSAYSDPDSGYRYTTAAGLGAPTGVSASDGTYTNRVMVQWNAVSGASAYTVWRYTANNSLMATEISETTGTSYDDTSASPDTVYYYWLRAKNDSGSSAFSSSDSGYRISSLSGLAAPGGVQASDGTYTDRVAVTWSAVGDALSYEVWRSRENDTAAAELVGDSATTGFDDSTAEPGMRYYYWVKSKNGSGASVFSSPDVGYSDLGSSASGSADLLLENFVFLPRVLGKGGTPTTTSMSLENLGPDAMAFPSTHVTVDFYLSASGVWGAIDNRWVGEYSADFNLAAGQTAEISLPSAALAAIIIPRDCAGLYSVFARIAHSSPSTLSDANKGNNVVQRLGNILVNATGKAAPAKCDYDGDGISDLALYQEGSGMWSFCLSANWNMSSASFGAPGYRALCGDFNGDGFYDFAAYQPATGLWYVRFTGHSALLSAQFGGPDYAAVPADLDGDGKTDLAVYRAADGLWLAMLSGRGYQMASANFGGPAYVAVPSDFDGDSKFDLAVYAGGTASWMVLLSGSGYNMAGASFGGPSYEAIPSDFDGDSKADPAIYQASDGSIMGLLSGSGYAPAGAVMGVSGCIPANGDYDGDGKADLAVYSSSGAYWIALPSAYGYMPMVIPMGSPGCVPVR